MKFISYQVNEAKRWGVLQGEEIIDLTNQGGYQTLLAFIEAGEEAWTNLSSWLKNESVSTYKLSDVKVLAPVSPKKNIICVGKNYRDHVAEMATLANPDVPQHTVFFTKPHTAIVGHEDQVESYPEITQQLDYEGELAIIIGKQGKNISKEEALDYVFGYTIMNDVSARDLQKQHMQFFKGKSLDTFAPLGPVVVHKSELTDPQALTIQTKVNDEVRQNGHTKDMIFPVAEIIEVISKGMTLEPGDVIATGTPSGVGAGFNPPKFIKAGDRVTIEVSGIGVLSNPIV